MDPHSSVSFEPGETIYENRRVLEWIRLYKVLMSTCVMALPAAYGLEMYYNEGVPSLRWMSENWNWFQVPMQF